MSAVPIIDPKVAVDHLLDARASLGDVRDSTLPGDAINTPVVDAIVCVNEALDGLSKLAADRAAQRARCVAELAKRERS